jgi:HNH endonuclease
LHKDPEYLSQLRKKNRAGKPSPRGEEHYNWKCGKPWKRFKDPRYQAWRVAVLERDDYTCQDCKRRCKKYEKGLAAHHIKTYRDYRELRYEISNGVTLCRQCHLTLHGRSMAPREPVPCACGCGTLIAPVDPYGRPQRYVNYHARRGKKQPESAKQKLSEERKGRELTPQHRAKIAAGLRNSAKRIGRPPKSS